MKLGLGTVQFGLDYGISNNEGRTPPEEVSRILHFATSVGIQVLDTSPSYGVSEQVLGSTITRDRDEFRIVSKTHPQVSDARQLERNLRESLSHLRRRRIYGLLMHRSSDLLSSHGAALYEELVRLKERGLVQKIGASIYSASEIDELMKRYSLDLIQVPINVLDQRLRESGHLQKMKGRDIEIHARSVFLQGLLLMPSISLPKQFKPLEEHLISYSRFISERSMSPVVAALNFVLQIPEIDVVICGVNKLDQLEEIVSASKRVVDTQDMRRFRFNDETLLNPALWNEQSH